MCKNKLNYRLVLVAVAVLAFAACKKECKQGEELQGNRCVDTTTTIPETEVNPCKSIEEMREQAESDYNTNAEACLGFVQVCMSHPEWGTTYESSFSGYLPWPDENGLRGNRRDSLSAANKIEERCRSIPAWTDGTMPEDFKSNVSNAGKNGRDALTNYDLWEQYIEEVIKCHSENNK